MKNNFSIFVILLFVIYLQSCSSDHNNNEIVGDDSGLVSLMLYNDLPVGFDSVEITTASDPIFSTITHFKKMKAKNHDDNNEGVEINSQSLDATIFYYDEKKVIVLSDGNETVSQIVYPDRNVSVELLLRLEFDDFGKAVNLIFSSNGETVFTVNIDVDKENEMKKTKFYSSNESYLDCVDRVTDEYSEGKYGKVAKLLTKACGTCALSAAAIICVFDRK